MWLVKSSATAWFTACPERLVPPPRGSRGTPCRAAMRVAWTTSAVARGWTTATGSIS